MPTDTHGIDPNWQRFQPRSIRDPVTWQGGGARTQSEIRFLKRHQIGPQLGNHVQDTAWIAPQIGAKTGADVPAGQTQHGRCICFHAPNIGRRSLRPKHPMPAPSLIVLIAIRLLLAAEAMIGLVTENFLATFVSGAALALTFLPQLVASRVNIFLPNSFLAAIALFVLATIYLGEMYDFYDRLWWWDLALHGGSAMGFGILGFLLILMLFEGDRYAAPPWALGVLSFCAAMAVGVIWEVFEYAMDQVFGLNMQKSGLDDTMGDLMVNTVGAALAGLAGAAYVKGRSIGLGGAFDSFVTANRSRFRKLFHRRPR